MLQITKQGNSIVVKGLDHALYPHSGTLEIPSNSVITVVDESDIVTFRSASNYDVLFSGLVSEITINGEAVTKENVGDKFGAISNSASGGGGGLTPEQEEKLNNAVQISDYNADKEAQSAIDESQNTAIEGLRGGLEGKQDKINDLDAIREGAGKGATAIQAETDPIWTAEKGNYYTKGETDGLVNEAKSSAASAMSVASSAEGIASTANSKADEALGKLETKADKGEIPSLNGYATESWVEGKGYLTEHQDISGKLDKTEAAETYQPKGNYATKAEIPSLDGYATESWVEGKGYLTEHQDISGKANVGDSYTKAESDAKYLTEHQSLEGYAKTADVNTELEKKQDVISDLDTIRDGAAKGATAIQEHQDISGKQDVITDLAEIRDGAALGKTALQSFTETDPVWTAEKGNYYTKDEADGKFLTEHQDISGKLDKTEAEATYQKKGEYVDVNTYNQHITDQTAVDEAQNSAIQGIEGNLTRIDSKADNALEGLNSKANKTDIKVYESKHPSEVTDENAIILNVVGTAYDLNNAGNWRLITVPDAEQIYGYYFGVKVSDITSEEKEIGRLIPEQGEGYVALTVIRNDNTVTFKSTPSASNIPYCYKTLYIHSFNDNTSINIASYREQTAVINLADNDYIIALGFEEASGSGRFLTNGLYASTDGQKPILIKNDQKIIDNFISKVDSYAGDTDYIRFDYINNNSSIANFKKINGESIIGSGNIEIQGGGGGITEETDPIWTAEKVNYYTKTEVNTSLESKADKTEIPTVPTNVSAFTNDAGYLTQHQTLKTINGETIVGNGNIEITSGEETDPIWTAEKVNYSTTEEMNIELNKKQDKLTNTTTMEVTYMDGSTETITLYKA